MERFRVKKKDFKKHRYFTAGGALNFLTYFGDLAPANNFLSTEISQIKPGIAAFAQYRYGPRMSLKAELLIHRHLPKSKQIKKRRQRLPATVKIL